MTRRGLHLGKESALWLSPFGLCEKLFGLVSDMSSSSSPSRGEKAGTSFDEKVDHVDATSRRTEVYNIADVDPVLAKKMAAVNDAIDEIGLTPYHWKLFCLNGFGYAVDSMLIVLQGITQPLIELEYKNPNKKIKGISLASAIGLLVGAVFWGFSADIIGTSQSCLPCLKVSEDVSDHADQVARSPSMPPCSSVPSRLFSREQCQITSPFHSCKLLPVWKDYHVIFIC